LASFGVGDIFGESFSLEVEKLLEVTSYEVETKMELQA